MSHYLEILNFLVASSLKSKKRGTWVAQSVKHSILDFSSGHDLMVHKFETRVSLCADSVEPAWDFLSPLSAPSTFSLSQNK